MLSNVAMFIEGSRYLIGDGEFIRIQNDLLTVHNVYGPSRGVITHFQAGDHHTPSPEETKHFVPTFAFDKKAMLLFQKLGPSQTC